MEKQYNLYNLEPLFKKYLLTENISPISLKNYLSDFRHFAGWVEFYNRSHRVILNEVKDLSRMRDNSNKLRDSSPTAQNDIDRIISSQTVSEYRSYLTTNNIPHKTINRRLSTIRKFCSFCISQGWMKENPAKKIINVIASGAKQSQKGIASSSRRDVGTPRDDILSQFKSDLEKEKLDQSVITSYLDDVKEFLRLL